MRPVHIHLILNHIPIIGIPFAAAFLIHGVWKGNTSSQKFALLALVIVALFVLPVYFTGEPAEDAVENLSGVVKSMIHNHEESGEISLVMTLLTGAAALLNLWLFQKNKANQKALWVVLALAAVTTGSLGYTGNLGGLIRHTEIRADSAKAAAPAANAIQDEKADKD